MYYKFRSIGTASSFFIACLIVFLSGCAATGTKGGEMQSELDTVGQNQGRIFFYRSASLVGAAIRPNISLNGAVVGESQPGGFFYVDVEPGIHEATARTEVLATLMIPIKAGEKRYVRSSIHFGVLIGRVELALIDAAQAQAELGTLSFTGTLQGGAPASPSVAQTPTNPARLPSSKPVTLDDLDALLPKN